MTTIYQHRKQNTTTLPSPKSDTLSHKENWNIHNGQRTWSTYHTGHQGNPKNYGVLNLSVVPPEQLKNSLKIKPTCILETQFQLPIHPIYFRIERENTSKQIQQKQPIETVYHCLMKAAELLTSLLICKCSKQKSIFQLYFKKDELIRTIHLCLLS